MKFIAVLFTVFSALVAVGAEKFDPKAPTSAVQFSQASGGSKIQPDWLVPSKEPFRLGPGDKVELEILGGDNTRQIALIGPDGMLYYDLLSGFDVSGMTLEELRGKLTEKLGSYYRFPQVSAKMAEVRSKRVWILGRVNKPGVYPIVRPTTVVDIISQAGGLFTSRFSGTTEELADLDHSFIMRGRRMLPVNFHRLLREGDMGQNVQLQPGDYVYLPSSLTKEIHVLGAVKQPRPVGFTQEMSLAAAIATSLGPSPNADLKRVAIVRGALVNPKIAVVDFEAIQQGRAQNIRLEPRDIVYVPSSRFS
jgi:protein involved in polysaccharide export with SLBB domain